MVKGKAGSIVILECLDDGVKSIPVMVLYKEVRVGEDWFWGPPGGSIDKGESEVECALRETEEEAYIKFERGELVEVGVCNGCYMWVVKIDNKDKRRKKMITSEWFKEKRFGKDSGKLKRVQKEMHDLTKVSMLEIRDALVRGERWVVDIYGKKIKLRKVFYNELRECDELMKVIEGCIRGCRDY